MKLIIVESPTKATTIKKFLGEGYKVLSSYGHVRDLPKSKLGIDDDFNPQYLVMKKAQKTVQGLKKELKNAEVLILATDEDREGESIAWHLNEILKTGDSYQRIVFHEITKPAIEKALKNSRKIDMRLVDAQQARRVLDRLVGYKLSPLLWKKIVRRLSAGRVQSVVVKLIVEREEEIKKFKAEEYWSVEALVRKSSGSTEDKEEFKAILVKKNEESILKLDIKNKEESEKILEEIKDAEYRIIDVRKKEVKKNPPPPFMTSSLQQEAWKRFHFPAKFTMRIAQNLYERGLITYHRSDSLNLSNISLLAAKDFIIKNYGKEYWIGYLRTFKTKRKNAQEAHEAIRPTYPEKDPSSFKEDKKNKKNINEAQAKLYKLIWGRFMASQMVPAIFDSVKADIKANNYTFRASGQTLKFEGYFKVYSVKFKENKLPVLENNEILKLIELLPLQHFTQPPARYNEASLIKVLEENGIGRPSTYAPTISTVQARNYIEKNEQKRFQPTEIGGVVNSFLIKHFPKIVDIDFTAKMEENLDKIANGEKEWVSVIKEFYGPFIKNLKKKEMEIPDKKLSIEKTDEKCPKCNSPLIIRLGKYGKFYACSSFPKCKYTKALEKNTLGMKCPQCKEGDIVAKRTKRGKIFYGCSNWPDCKLAFWDKPTGKLCPKCNLPLIETKRKQIKCSNKECDYVQEDKPKA